MTEESQRILELEAELAKANERVDRAYTIIETLSTLIRNQELNVQEVYVTFKPNQTITTSGNGTAPYNPPAVNTPYNPLTQPNIYPPLTQPNPISPWTETNVSIYTDTKTWTNNTSQKSYQESDDHNAKYILGLLDSINNQQH